VQIEPGRDILVDLLEELQEFLVAVSAVQLADDGAVGDVEGGEQRRDRAGQAAVAATQRGQRDSGQPGRCRTATSLLSKPSAQASTLGAPSTLSGLRDRRSENRRDP
jgi:hypothetical protein